MCGIFCALSTHGPIWPSLEHEHSLRNRGPDSQERIHRRFATSTQDVHVTCFSTVLALRGSDIVKQPYQESGDGPMLCWNGEAWSSGGKPTHGNDTQEVYRLLGETSENGTHRENDNVVHKADAIARILSSIAGPYAFVYYDPKGVIFFGRDCLGRRSLLVKVTEEGDLLLASVTDESTTGWTEVEADGLYCLDLNNIHQALTKVGANAFDDLVRLKVPYHFTGDHGGNDISVIPRLSLNRQESIETPNVLHERSPSVLKLEQLLVNAIAHRIRRIPEPPVRQEDSDIPPARLGILFSGGLDCTVLAKLSHNMLEIKQPIDLLNVAFENPRVHKTTGGSTAERDNAYELCPDRITGRAAYEELRRVCPKRVWRFVAINVPYTETMAARSKVMRLMHPHNTEMDLSICFALYFAARGTGNLEHETHKTRSYTTSARVLLSGLGADELFAGYTRHATAFRRNGPSGLLDELDVDIGRLGKRNLGRDDRVITDSSREVRFPYLDETLIAWALALPYYEKCDFRSVDSQEIVDNSENLEAGKKVLRCLAWKQGMKNVAKEKKRAIQFGARTAKMETGKSKGTHLVA